MEFCKGIIHSFESFGCVDGPGVRFVVFLQGCNMRCKFCHNADTWSLDAGKENEIMTAEQVISKAENFESYWGEDGGITVSGGEPLVQIDFVLQLFTLCKQRGYSTVIDTAGQPFTTDEPFFTKFKELMKVTDLVMLDIKHIDSKRHKELTGRDNENILALARYLSESGKDMWIRHVLVPGYTDDDESLKRLCEFISSLKTVKKVEVLPYHTFGSYKWEKLGLAYPLKGVEPPTKQSVENAKRILGISE